MTAERGDLLGQLIVRWSTLTPEQPAYESGRHHVRYRELAAIIDRLAGELGAAGVEPGDRVLLRFPSSPEYVASLLAVSAMRAIAVAVPPAAGPARVDHIVAATAPRLDLRGLATEPVAGIRDLVVDIDPERSELRAPAARGAVSQANRPPASGADPVLIILSSGSTGQPKPVVLAHRQLLANAGNLAASFGLDTGHRELVIAPMVHSGAFQRVIAALYVGGCVVASEQALSPAGVLQWVERFRIAGFYIPPPLARLILRLASPAPVSPRSLRSIELGSASVTPDELRAIARRFPSARVYFHYGLTECSRAFILSVDDMPDALTTMGRATPGVEVQILDPDGSPLAPGEAGQIALRGPQLSSGYWNRPDLDREMFRSGWLLTGDHGSIDGDGRLTLLGRRDDMISSAGYHFFPAEVEGEIGPVAGITDYLIAGVPDGAGILGQVPCAFVVPRDPSTFTAREFLAVARRRVAPYMVPREVVVLPEIPLTASGKPDRARAAADHARARAGAATKPAVRDG